MSGTKRKLTPTTALARLRRAFQKHLGLGHAAASTLLGSAKLYDKAYELSCLIETMRHLKAHVPNATFTLINGTNVTFRAKGGPIDRMKWPYIAMASRSVHAEIWVDIECLALSAWSQNKRISGVPYGKAHELDVIVVKPGARDRPSPDLVEIGVEAKHRKYSKALLKELLGVRREMSFKADLQPNYLAWWVPTGQLPADPPSGLVLFCSGNNVLKYQDPADFWGITMIQHQY